MIIFAILFLTFLLHNISIKYYSYNRIVQYYLSLLHSIISILLYTYTYKIKDYEDIFDINELIAIGFHIGYFLSDTLVEYKFNNAIFIFHHIYSLYFIILNYYFGTIGILQRAMLVAEITSLFFNIRTIYIKKRKQKTIIIELPFTIIYFLLRCIYCPYLLYDYYYNYHNINIQLILLIIIFWLISTKWMITMIISNYKSIVK